MKYKGIELKEFTSDKTVVFDPPKKMFVWVNEADDLLPVSIRAYIPQMSLSAITDSGNFAHCAEIPEESKPRRATNIELMKWLAQGNGCRTNTAYTGMWAVYQSYTHEADKLCDESVLIRKWDDKEWHEPTADYMGLEG